MEHISGKQHEGFYIAVRAEKTEKGWACETRTYETYPADFDDPSEFGRFKVSHVEAQNETEAVEMAEKNTQLWISSNLPKIHDSIAQKRRLQEQWDLARHVYAWFQVLSSVHGNERMFLSAQRGLNEAQTSFCNKGGVVKEGRDALGVKEPALFLSDGRRVPFEAGRMLVEHLASQARRFA